MSEESPSYIPLESFDGKMRMLYQETDDPHYEDVIAEAFHILPQIEYPEELFEQLHAMMARNTTYANRTWHTRIEKLRKALFV